MPATAQHHIPKGLKEAVGPKLGDSNARGFFKQVLTELEGAVERAGETYGEKKPAEAADLTWATIEA